MADAKRDSNYVTTLIAVSNVDGVTPVVLYADPTTHRLLVDSSGGGANTALSNLASVAINESLLPGTSDAIALGSTTKMWSDLFLASGAVINFNNGNMTITHSAGVLTVGGGNLALGTNSLTMTGSIGATGARVTKLWATDIESTNMPTVGGTSLSSTFLALAGGTMGGVIAMGTNKITGMGDPTADQDAATKAYVDGVAQGLAVKESVKVATTEALPANTYNNGASGVGATLTGVATGELTVDGSVVALNDIILVKDEVTAANNGIYVCTTAGALGVAYVLTRSVNMNQAAEIPGAFCFVEDGTVNDGAGFVVADAGPFTIGTTAINWTQFSGAGQITAGAGLTKTGNTLAVGAGTGITVNADDVAIDTAVVARKADNLSVFAATTSAQLAGIISDETGSGALVFGTSPTLTTPRFADLGFIADANGNELIVMDTVASAVNEIKVANAATGSAPEIAAQGGDTNISLQLTPKGTGIVKGELKRFMVRILDSATALTTGTTKGGDFRISNRAITVKAVGAYVDTAATGATLIAIDINEAGTTILSTKITLDASEKSSETAATPPVISDSAIAADAVVTIDIDAIGNTTPGNGLTVWIDYVYA